MRAGVIDSARLGNRVLGRNFPNSSASGAKKEIININKVGVPDTQKGPKRGRLESRMARTVLETGEKEVIPYVNRVDSFATSRVDGTKGRLRHPQKEKTLGEQKLFFSF